MAKSPKASDIDADAVRKLADLLNETGLTEIEYTYEDWSLRVSKGATAVAATVRAVEAETALEEMRSQVIDSTFRAMELEKQVEELQEEAQKSKALLIYNFPNNRWAGLSKKLLKSKKNSMEDKGMITSIKNYIKVIFD